MIKCNCVRVVFVYHTRVDVCAIYRTSLYRHEHQWIFKDYINIHVFWNPICLSSQSSSFHPSSSSSSLSASSTSWGAKHMHMFLANLNTVSEISFQAAAKHLSRKISRHSAGAVHTWSTKPMAITPHFSVRALCARIHSRDGKALDSRPAGWKSRNFFFNTGCQVGFCVCCPFSP